MRLALLTLVALGCSSASHEHKHDSGHDHSSASDTDLPDDFDDTQEKLSQDGLAYVTYTTDDGTLPESVEFGVTITLMDPDDQATVLDNATVTTVDATMPSHGGHGMNVTPDVTNNGDGTFTAMPIKLHMPGHWVLHVDIEVNGVTDTTEFDIECCD
jgi:hypothetical protein